MFHTGGSLHAVVDKGLTLCLSKDIELKLNCSSATEEQPLRLHQFVCTAFRSELNVAENGAGKPSDSFTLVLCALIVKL